MRLFGKRLLYLIDSLGKWSGQVIAPLALIYMAIIIYEIAARYAFNSPTRWAHETTTFIFGAQFMLGGAYCFWRGSMVNVEIFHDRLPIKARAILDLFLFVVPLVICCLMIWKGGSFFWVSLQQLERTQTVFKPPLYPLRGIIPLAALLLLIQVVGKFIRDLHIAITGAELK